VSSRRSGFAALFPEHCHGLISDGAFSPEEEFLPLPSLDASAVMQLFRRLLLLRLHKAERQSDPLCSGFSLHT